ncbi:ALR1 [Candida jiufengensis]|uniref:ALR1 n=1 Tax=Candida jiufengensis TaxID=497108 RepID=UPI002224747E|nr:ALR1 [Candida jiufengensis]KAI5953244.1 ALR1 [Candida jiufengensis]
MSDTESYFQPTNSSQHNNLNTDEVLNDHRNQMTSTSCAVSEDEDDTNEPINKSTTNTQENGLNLSSTNNNKIRSNSINSNHNHHQQTKQEIYSNEGNRKKSIRRSSARRSSVGENVNPQLNRSYMTTLRKDFYLKEDDDSPLTIPLNNQSISPTNPININLTTPQPLPTKSRRRSTLENLQSKKNGRSMSNNFENDILSPMIKTKTNESFVITNNGNGEEIKIRRQSRSSIDSEADSHGSRSSQETEEDVCFPMMREHIKINGIDFDEIDEFIREEREEAEIQKQFISKNKSIIDTIDQFSSNNNNNNRNNSSSGISRQPTSSAALKYTPKNILKSFTRSEEIQDSATTSSSIEEIKFKQESLEDDDKSSIEQVKFGGARISDGANGALPDRFSFFHSENEETVHAPDIPSLVSNGQSIRELFHNGEETWWLDCTCPTDAEMKMLAKAFGIHPLTAEDIRMQETREKVELFKSYYFVCFHTFEPDKESEDYLEPINVYIVVFRDGILTFHFSPISHPANVRRRVRQLRDYVDVTADWLCYAMIDDITDSFAPVIHGIEYEADAIEDAVFTARDTDFSNMLQRIGDSRRKVMTLMRLLSGKADVIKMFAKRCQDEANTGYRRQHQQRLRDEYSSPHSSSTNIHGLNNQSSSGGGGSQPPPPPQQQQHYGQPPSSWAQNTTYNARPRADIALYLGDIQDHIITMFQNLLAYEKIFSRSHSNYLAQLQVESFNSNTKISEMFSKVTIIGTMLVPLNLVTGLFGMNVKVPGEGSTIYWFYGILGVLLVVIILSICFANWWLRRMNRQINGAPRPVFNSRRSIRSLASPSTSDPNYYYQWTRDSAISIKSLIYYIEDNYRNELSNNNGNEPLNKNIIKIIELYILNEYKLQRVPNKSGNFNDLKGLGEPKFNVDMTAFNENWGRPQRDGPALRISTILEFIHYLNQTNSIFQNSNLQNYTFIFNDILKPDLQYILKFYDCKGFDLWEEIDSIHFYTSMVQLKALQQGFIWFNYFKDKIDGIDTEFTNDILDAFNKLKSNILKDFNFINQDKDHIIEIPSLLENGERGGLDIASTLAVVHTHELDFIEKYNLHNDNNLKNFRIPFQINNSYVLNSFRKLVDDMKYRYTINYIDPNDNDNNSITGCGLGRYPEDIYDGHNTSEGNPWFLATSTASEFLYQFIFNLYKFELDLQIDKSNYEFFKPFINYNKSIDSKDENITNITYEYNSKDFNNTLIQLFKYGDSFLNVVRRHSDLETGQISEQFNRNTGFMQGARELTWSYSALWNAIRWRDKLLSIIDV